MTMMMTLRHTALGLLLAGLLSLLGGCGYYAQSAAGQWEVIRKRQPIEAVVADPATPVAVRQKLHSVLRIRDFASRTLHLPDNGSYRSYADLGRPFVVWNVFAAPPDALRLEQWCFPVAGCVSYRGYFSESAARAFAAQLSARGLETYVAGVTAYSTLGWFDDPVLNTVLGRSEARLAGLIFHELAHQQLYVEGDTAFNEGFASSVEQEGVRRWLAAEETDGRSAGQATADKAYRGRQQAFVTLVTRTRDRLAALYAEPLAVAERQWRREALIAHLRAGYANLKRQWGGYAGYDAWFAGPLNNAQLAAVTTYSDYVPGFRRLLARQGGDLQAFYRVSAELGALPVAARKARLRALLADGG